MILDGRGRPRARLESPLSRVPRDEQHCVGITLTPAMVAELDVWARSMNVTRTAAALELLRAALQARFRRPADSPGDDEGVTAKPVFWCFGWNAGGARYCLRCKKSIRMNAETPVFRTRRRGMMVHGPLHAKCIEALEVPVPAFKKALTFQGQEDLMASYRQKLGFAGRF